MCLLQGVGLYVPSTGCRAVCAFYRLYVPSTGCMCLLQAVGLYVPSTGCSLYTEHLHLLVDRSLGQKPQVTPLVPTANILCSGIMWTKDLNIY